MGNLLLFSQKRHKPIKFERKFRLLECNFDEKFVFERKSVKKHSSHKICCCAIVLSFKFIADAIDAFYVVRQIGSNL